MKRRGDNKDKKKNRGLENPTREEEPKSLEVDLAEEKNNMIVQSGL